MEMIVMSPEGDTKHQWDMTNPDEAKLAAEMFALYKSCNYAIFEVKGRGKKGEPVTIFDPDIGIMLMVPMMAGG